MKKEKLKKMEIATSEMPLPKSIKRIRVPGEDVTTQESYLRTNCTMKEIIEVRNKLNELVDAVNMLSAIEFNKRREEKRDNDKG